MKKIFSSIIIIGLVFLTSCRSGHFSCVESGVKAVSKCCNNIKEIKNVFKKDIAAKEDLREPNQKIDSPFPAYIWDTRMIIW